MRSNLREDWPQILGKTWLDFDLIETLIVFPKIFNMALIRSEIISYIKIVWK